MKPIFASFVFSAAILAGPLIAQTNQTSPGQPPAAPPLFAPPGLPPGVGPQRAMPVDPAGPNPKPQPVATPASTSLILFLDTTAPFVQAFDLVLMLATGIYCLSSVRRKRNTGLLLLAISCFVSVIILFGFFLFAIMHGRGALPQRAYIIARLLAPFELLLFVIGIIWLAKHNKATPAD